MIWNPGQLPPDWTIESLLEKHASEPFNPDVANAFFRAGMIETWGRGIERILEACAAAALPTPDFRYEKTGLWTEFRFSDKHIDLGGKVGAITQDGLGEKLGEELGETRAAIVRAMLANPKVTTTRLAQSLSMSTTAVEKHLRLLKAQGQIERVGPARGGHWKVKGTQS